MTVFLSRYSIFRYFLCFALLRYLVLPFWFLVISAIRFTSLNVQDNCYYTVHCNVNKLQVNQTTFTFLAGFMALQKTTTCSPPANLRFYANANICKQVI